ncbi:MAG: type II toxin-antitoxin system VapC family toxin [Gemmatimonas sp.]
MKLLLDTHILLCVAGQPKRLSAAARKLITDERNDLVFSAASLWEITIKNGLGRDDFRVEPRVLRRALLDNGYVELAITSEHAVQVEGLPDLHRDPFDRIIVAQAQCEGITLLTTDAIVARYPGPIRKV